VPEHSISLTTMGVGLDYKRELNDLSCRGRGRELLLHRKPPPSCLHSRKEFDRLGCVVAQNAVIELTTGRGVALLDVVGAEFTDVDGRIRIPVGDVYDGGQRREFTVEITVPPGRGTLVVAEGLCASNRPGQGKPCPGFAAWTSGKRGPPRTGGRTEIQDTGKGRCGGLDERRGTGDARAR